MHTNELLEEKYKAQKLLALKAREEKKDYFEMINDEAKALFELNGWEMKFSGFNKFKKEYRK